MCSKQKNKVKTSEMVINKTKINNLPGKEFKVIFIKMITELGETG